MPAIGTSSSVNKLPGTATGASSTSATQFTDSAGNAAILYLPCSGSYANRMFRVRAYGRATTAGAYTLVIGLYYGISATVGSNTLIAVSSARSISTASANWYIEAVMMQDSTSQKVGGHQLAMVNNLFDTTAALSNGLTSVNLSTGTEGGIGFTAAATFSSSSATNAAYLISFELEPL